jgi:hypothetical protein
MSLQKTKMTEYQVEANYWTIIKANINLQPLPKYTFDENGDVNGIQGGSQSDLTLGLFVSKEAYDSQMLPGIDIQPMEVRSYTVPFEFVISAVRSTESTVEELTYAYIKANDPFFSDALEVE